MKQTVVEDGPFVSKRSGDNLLLKSRDLTLEAVKARFGFIIVPQCLRKELIQEPLIRDSRLGCPLAQLSFVSEGH